MHLIKQIHGGSFVAVDIKTNVQPLTRRDFSILKSCFKYIYNNSFKEFAQAKSCLKNPFALDILQSFASAELIRRSECGFALYHLQPKCIESRFAEQLHLFLKSQIGDQNED
jgi:hypothetical protein